MKHKHNVLLISTFLKNHDEFAYSRTELADETGISRKTVTGVVKGLHRELKLQEVEQNSEKYYLWRGE